MAEEAEDGATRSSGYTAVVYVHGIGSQRRYEETSHLIDAIDVYLNNSTDEAGRSLGRLVDIEPRSEVRRDGGAAIGGEAGDDVATYISVKYLPSQNGRRDAPIAVRFYEAYWAPIMAGSKSPRGVASWLFGQCLRPLATVWTPWRERQRLRRAALSSLYDDRPRWPTGATEADFETLLRAYGEFHKLDAKRAHPKGNAPAFKAFLAARDDLPDDASKRRRLSILRAWRRRYARTEAMNAFFILTFIVTLGLAAAALVALALIASQSVTTSELFGDVDSPLTRAIADALRGIDGSTPFLIAGLLISLLTGRFLTDYLGDVEAWATHEETNEKHEKRKHVIAMCARTIRHALADERCGRLVIIGHSLGSSIAHDTLLNLARRNRAEQSGDPISGPTPLYKIRQFVTMGSPIDKVHYFFESLRSRSHRYTRVFETLRGDIGQPPFSRNRKPFLHWVNFWDEADVISGPLHSPTAADGLAHRVDNVHVASYAFPAPGASHAGYFEHAGVIGPIFEMIFRNRANYDALALRDFGGGRKGYDYASCAFGPGEATGGRNLYFAAAVAIPWLIVAALIAWAAEWTLIRDGLAATAAITFGALALSWFNSRRAGRRRPL